MAQKLIRCDAGHIYDSAVHAACPECGEPRESICERGHSYDPAGDDSCPVCRREDAAPQADSGAADPVRHDANKEDVRRKESSGTGLWIGVAAAVLALAGGGYFFFTNGSRDDLREERTRQRASAEKTEVRKTAIEKTPKDDESRSAEGPRDQEKAAGTRTVKRDDDPSIKPIEKVEKESGVAERDEKAGEPSDKQERSANRVVQDENPSDTSPPRQGADTVAEGDAKAQYERGLAYETGNGVSKDPAQAVAWYRKAAARGDLDRLQNSP